MKCTRHSAFVFLLLLLLLSTAGCTQSTPQITQLQFLNWGYEDTRYTNLYHAVQEFNQMHPDRPYALNIEKYQDNDWDEYQALCEQRHEEGAIDLFTTGHEYIGALAEQEIIMPLDDLLCQEVFQDEYFSTIWSSVTYNGQYWGMPLDTDVQMVFVNRAALRAAGYSEAMILNLPEQTASGQFTMEDLMEIAHAGMDKAGCQYGVLHRPKNGQFFYMMAQAFGSYTISENGDVLFHEEQYGDMLSFYREMVSEGLLPTDMTTMSWYEVNQAFTDGQTAVYFGACYSLYDAVVECNAVAEDVLAQYVPILFPPVREGGRPLTISHPMVYMVDSNSKYAEDIMEILSIAFSDSHNLATHCATTYHLPASASVLEDSVFQNNTFLMDSVYMLDYAVFLPTHPNIHHQMDILFEDITLAEQSEQPLGDIVLSASYRFASS